MALGDRAFAVAADVIGISLAEAIFRRGRRQQAPQAGGQQHTSPPPIPHIPGILADPDFPADQRIEIAAWLVTLSQDQKDYLERIATGATGGVDRLKNILLLSLEKRRQVLAGGPQSLRDVGRQVKRGVEALEPNLPKTKARWKGYAARHGHEARKARDAQLREEGPPGIPELGKNFWEDMKKGWKRPEGQSSFWEDMKKGWFGRSR